MALKFEVSGESTPGVELVAKLLEGDETGGIALTPETAEQAIGALETITFPGLFEEIIESGEEFAKQVHSIANRGLQEVVQNADDQGATNIRFGYRRRGGTGELLIAHDGKPVDIDDVIRMTLPLLSGSRKDPDKIGRFGIGLKTLKQLGETLEVHCPPVPGIEIRGGRLKRIHRAQAAIRGFWNPGERETLFIVRLERTSFDWAFFKDWLNAWDASSLLFLRSLRSVSLTNFAAGRKRKTLQCALELGRARAVELKLAKAPQAQETTIKDASGRRRWTRYSVQYPKPRRLRATNKEIGDTVSLQVAIPEQEGENRVYVGLPLEEPCELPYSFSAPFDPNAERTKLRDNNDLNEWLIDRIGDLATAISLRRFEEQPRSGWRSVPLQDDVAGESDWAAECFSKMVDRQRARVTKGVSLTLPDGKKVKLSKLAYEPPEFERLIDSKMLDRLRERTLASGDEHRTLPPSWRDRGRWRDFLNELNGPRQLRPWECLEMLDWPSTELPAEEGKWLVQMVGAGLKTGEEDVLQARKCIALGDDRGRMSPAEVKESGIVLVHSAARRGLAATLNLTIPIARPFRARNETAGAVRAWLSGEGVLHKEASDLDAVRALARARLDTPIDLRKRDSAVLRLRGAFEQLPTEERPEVGKGLGENIGLAGYSFEKGKRVPRLTRPSEAYLPSAIDKSSGWSTAAAQTPGLQWIDRHYSNLLQTKARGGGALGFLRALGAAIAPRLVAGPDPPASPHAPKLRQKVGLSAQHREELSDCQRATGLRDDRHSPDLEAAVGNLMKERRQAVRRKRARALFMALDRAWNDTYAEHTTAIAVYHKYHWYSDGEVSASWLAWLASEPWLSTQETKFQAAAPRDLTVLTEAAYEIEGANRSRYAHEIEETEVDSPLVDALEIQGRPRVDTILDRLESLRDREAAGQDVDQAWVDSCYAALNSYVPGGRYSDRSDIPEADLKRAFGKKRGAPGLIRSGGRWLAPGEARLGSAFDLDLGWVNASAGLLWQFLGIERPSPADCVNALNKLLAKDAATARSDEILAFRRLLDVHREGQLKKRALKGLALRLHEKPKGRVGKTVFAVSNPLIAEALGRKWQTWRPPAPLAELDPLIPFLDVTLLAEQSFSAEIPAHLTVSRLDLQDDFVSAVGHLQDYLAVHHPSLHDRLSAAQWNELSQAHVIVGADWGVRARAGRRRSELLSVRAHLFRDPLQLCLAHEDEIDEPEAGGEAIAGFIAGEAASSEERSTLALAWAHAYRIRDKTRQEISISPEEGDAQSAPPAKSFDDFARKRKRKRRRVKKTGTKAPPPPQRELVDLDELRLDRVKATFLEGKRRTRLRVPPKTKLSDRSRAKSDSSGSRAANRTTHPQYTGRDKEDIAFAIVEEMLNIERGLNLEDVRGDGSMGADAVDREQDIWVELKAHGQDAPETFRFPSSEALRAEEKRGKYWLVVVWGLEQPRTPEFAIVPDPLHRLDTYIGNGMYLTGLRDLKKKS